MADTGNEIIVDARGTLAPGLAAGVLVIDGAHTGATPGHILRGA